MSCSFSLNYITRIENILKYLYSVNKGVASYYEDVLTNYRNEYSNFIEEDRDLKDKFSNLLQELENYIKEKKINEEKTMEEYILEQLNIEIKTLIQIKKEKKLFTSNIIEDLNNEIKILKTMITNN